jgi:hypothetical protein
MPTITFPSPVKVVLRAQTTIPEISEDISTIEIVEMTDSPITKKVTVRIKGSSPSKFQKNIVLWQGDEYDAIGQWTDQDVEDRIKEIYGNV